jgi:hypothetical protein
VIRAQRNHRCGGSAGDLESEVSRHSAGRRDQAYHEIIQYQSARFDTVVSPLARSSTDYQLDRNRGGTVRPGDSQFGALTQAGRFSFFGGQEQTNADWHRMVRADGWGAQGNGQAWPQREPWPGRSLVLGQVSHSDREVI